jgi:hypothetical protein
MKLKIDWIISLSIIVLAYSTCLAQIEPPKADWGVHALDYSSVGTAGWQFLKLPTTARNAALGGIITALSYGNASSTLANPASTADVVNYDVSFSHMKWVADIGFQTVAAVKNFGNWGIIGVNLMYVDYGEMVRTENSEIFDALGTSLGVFPVFDDLGTFTANDISIGLSYARQVTDKLQVGGNLRYLREQLDDATTSNWSVDIGTMYYTGLKTLRIAMLGKNFGPDAEFAEYDERIGIEPVKVKMPMWFALGLALDVIESKTDNPHRLIVAAEYVLPNDGLDKVNVGTEYAFMDMFFLRAGYRFNYDVEGLTLGAGLDYNLAGMQLKIDYAFLDVGLFKQLHMFTIGMGF